MSWRRNRSHRASRRTRLIRTNGQCFRVDSRDTKTMPVAPCAVRQFDHWAAFFPGSETVMAPKAASQATSSGVTYTGPASFVTRRSQTNYWGGPSTVSCLHLRSTQSTSYGLNVFARYLATDGPSPNRGHCPVARTPPRDQGPISHSLLRSVGIWHRCALDPHLRCHLRSLSFPGKCGHKRLCFGSSDLRSCGWSVS